MVVSMQHKATNLQGHPWEICIAVKAQFIASKRLLHPQRSESNRRRVVNFKDLCIFLVITCILLLHKLYEKGACFSEDRAASVCTLAYLCVKAYV